MRIQQNLLPEISDAVVIGSRIVKEIEASDKIHIFSNVKKLVAEYEEMQLIHRKLNNL